ncbi:MAG: replicative DNA helicase [Lachnospiraceae bacterium]|nr:replicative DNA helicase [Lachnospiraceae bacterium]
MAEQANDNVYKRIPPSDEKAECYVLGSLMLTEDDLDIDAAVKMLTPEDFNNKFYSNVYDAIVRLHDSNSNIDIDTVFIKCKELGYLDDISRLSDIVSATYSSASIKTHCQTVRDRSTLRSLLRTCEKISDDIYKGNAEAKDMFDQAERDLFTFLQNRRGVKDFEQINKIVSRVLYSISDSVKSDGRITGVPTGFTDLDNTLTGLHGSELILIAARPAMGKTAFALNIVANACIDHGCSAAVFSLEMAKDELIKRILAQRSGVSSDKIRTGSLDEADINKLVSASERISSAEIAVDDTSGIKVSDVRAKCRKIIRERGKLDLIVIDYLQLMKGDGRFSSRENEVASISRDLKGLAKELNVPIVALAQLNRSAANREGHRPMMSDLRESGSIEQDADVIMFIHREEYYEPDTPKRGIAEIIIAKQRNGSTGPIELVWMGDKTMFANKDKPKNRIQTPD